MPDASSADFPSHAWQRLVWRLRACWRFKLFLTLLLSLFFWAGYGYLSRHALFPVRTMPLTWVDELIPFQPVGWSVVYVSEFIFTPLVPWLLTSRDALRRYAIGLLVLCGASFFCFLFLPVASPRPALMTLDGCHRFIVTWDGPYNAFPSLHAGFVAYTMLLLRRAFDAGLSRWLWLTVWIWAALVMISTIATRQHYSVDLAAGAVIGLIADAVAWRQPKPGPQRRE